MAAPPQAVPAQSARRSGAARPGCSTPQAKRGLDPAREAEFRDAARKLYSHLGETEQRIIDLRMQGHTTDEVAARLGLNPIALRVRMTRLRKRLEETGVLADWL